MFLLLIVSLVWAFSFGLIKDQLTGLDSNFVAFSRMVLSLIVFIPFARTKRISFSYAGQLILLGAVQFGLMYVAYIFAYQYLKAYQVALFTIFTPIYISLINDLIEERFNYLNLNVAVLATIGAGIIVITDIGWVKLGIGFILMQVSNMAFAFGQVYYRKLMNKFPKVPDTSIFAFLYLGAVLLTGIFSFFTTDYSQLSISKNQILILVYLGVLASGVCFFLWNLGARRTEPGILAVFNNLKVPLAIFISLVFFKESTDMPRLIIGGSLIVVAMIIADGRWIKKMPSL